jgi:NADPH2:quinone reductase
VIARVIGFHKTGGPDVLQIDDVDIGAPGPGELRLRVHAFGLNRAEAISLWYVSGAAEAAQQARLRGGRYSRGDRRDRVRKVLTIPAFSMNQYSVYGEQAIVPAAATVKHPDTGPPRVFYRPQDRGGGSVQPFV